MKTFLLLVTPVIFLFALSGCSNHEPVADHTTINPVIGDISFMERFGILPDNTTNEDVRISTHLAYVESKLRQRDVSSLSPELQAKRTSLLDLLHEYWTAGKFPRNYDYEGETKPCFIDRHGNICAVGYLVEQTAGRAFAEGINDQFQYSRIYEMNSQALAAWISGSGFTLKEIAMIQPSYVYYHDPIDPGYGIATATWSGTNLSLMTLNTLQIVDQRQSNTVPVLGLISGAGQLLFGSIKLHQYSIDENFSGLSVSLINIGFGTGTAILSAYNLFSGKPAPKEKSTSWNIYGFPAEENEVGFGFGLIKRF